MRVLVTGGAGFIGSALVDRLVGEGHHVTVIDDLSSGREENLAGARRAGVDLVRADITAPELTEVVRAARPEVVHHLAAQMDVRRSVADPVFDARVNVVGSVAVARAAAEAGCRRLVFAGSGGTAYGEVPGAMLPVGEDGPRGVSNPYGVAKRSVEDYLRTFDSLFGLETVSLRLGNVYGPRQDPHGEAGVVAIFCSRLLEERPVTVFGDGKQTRDYVFVSDVVDAFVAAAAAPAASGSVVNVGTGAETSVLELYDALRAEAGTGGEVEHAPARPGELERIALDVTRAGDLLGWQPQSTLREGLRRTWAWASQQSAGSA
jgi:UDP-glucose 4-epimerase